MSRPSVYEKYNWGEKLDLIRKWARSGLTDKEIAEKMCINKSTLYEYKKKYPEFANALKESKRVADAKVEQALYKNAIGYYYEEESMAPTGEIREIRKYAKPQTSAQKTWLRNRQPDRWREKQEHEITGKDGGPVVFTELVKKVDKWKDDE